MGFEGFVGAEEFIEDFGFKERFRREWSTDGEEGWILKSLHFGVLHTNYQQMGLCVELTVEVDKVSLLS